MLERIKSIYRKFSNQKNDTIRDTIEELIEETPVEDADIDIQERKLISNVLRISEYTVNDISVPRTDIVGIQVGAPFTEVIQIFKRTGFSRLIVYRETLDDVIGCIHVRDLLACGPKFENIDYAKIVGEILFISPSMKLLDLLLQMRATKVAMACVVDEHGGIDGLVTAWNVVNELIGDIEGMYTNDTHKDILNYLSDGSLVVSGRLELKDFEHECGQILSDAERNEEDIETIAGLVVFIAGRVPTAKEVIVHENSGVEFEILEADPRKVSRVRVYLPKKDTSSND